MHKEFEERELENPDHYKRPKEYQNAASICYREQAGHQERIDSMRKDEN